MPRPLIRMLARLGLPLTLLLVAMACGKKDKEAANEPPVVLPSTVPAATPAPAKVTDFGLGKHVGTDKHIADKADSFSPRDTVYLSVITEGAAPDAQLTARWMYQGKQLVSEKTEHIAPTSGGSTATEFHIIKPSGWPKGKYTVEVLLNGTSSGTKDFEVK